MQGWFKIKFKVISMYICVLQKYVVETSIEKDLVKIYKN